MACNDPYHNPAGLKFVTRVEIGNADPLWPDDLPYEQDQLVMNIPNGAGPGTILLQTQDAYADWRILGTKNLVRSQQRAYTGPASWEEVWVEDGAFINCRIQGVTQLHVNLDGIENNVASIPLLRALWFPNGARIPTFDRLSITSGLTSPPVANGFPFRSLANNAVATVFPPGLCRYLQVTSGGAYDFSVQRDTVNTQYFLGTAIPATTATYVFVPAWAEFEFTNTSGTTNDVAFCWSRYPMVGS